jgi:hypothetical protein
MVFNATFNNISVIYIVAVSFIGGRNGSTRRKPSICCKSLTNFITYNTSTSTHKLIVQKGPLWLYGSWIYNYLCNQYLSSITLYVRIPLRRGVLNTTLCDKVCQWLAADRWFSPGTPISTTNKTDRHNIYNWNILAWAGFEHTTLLKIGTDYTGSYKSNYHTITMAPSEL